MLMRKTLTYDQEKCRVTKTLRPSPASPSISPIRMPRQRGSSEYQRLVAPLSAQGRPQV
jgi:hypothetical protein